jgi:hypothetical protein
VSNGYPSTYLVASDFGFSVPHVSQLISLQLPSVASVTGIEVKWRRADQGSPPKEEVRIALNSTLSPIMYANDSTISTTRSWEFMEELTIL